MSVAILIDGSFFLKRYRNAFGTRPPSEVAKDLHTMALKHVNYIMNGELTERANSVSDLYRIFYYDSPPLGEKGERTQNPISKEHIEFKKTDEFKFRTEFLSELKKKRKIALRLGRLSTSGWTFKSSLLVKDICSGKQSITDIQATDIEFSIKQKGVDMKIGLDIASLAYKKLVKTIVLIAGDSDFVPAAKLARREGIDFILDSMGADNITDDLFEHIDGLKSFKPSKERNNNSAFNKRPKKYQKRR